MDNICRVCNVDCESEESLHKHLRTHKIVQAVYYHTYFPCYDKFDGQLIKFKNKDYYFHTDFNTRANLTSWISNNSPTDNKKYLLDFLTKRAVEKKLVYAPCQVEMRSLMIPGIKFYEGLFGSYYDLCEDLGLKNKYETFKEWGDWRPIDKSSLIYCDTREKTPLTFPACQTQSIKLEFGDYSLDDVEWTGGTAIERKTLPDFLGTFSTGLERFKKEIERCKQANSYLIIMVEAPLHMAIDYKAYGIICSKINTAPEFVFHNVRQLCQEYPNIQFLFVDSKEMSEHFTVKLFSLGKQIHKYDLQLMLDKHRL